MDLILYLINFLITLSAVFLSLGENCHDKPVTLDESFFGCCKGRPKYTSEPCIDALLENGTLSQECVVNCMYRELEIYDGVAIDMAAVKTFVDSAITDEDFNAIYSNAYERCSKLDKTSIKEKFPFITNKNEFDCDDYPVFMDICIWYHTIANCPEKYATKDETCDNKRQWVKECLLES